MQEGPEQRPPTAAMCPSCERFIGPARACPYCGADAPDRPGLRFLRWASLLLASLGLAFLYLTATRRAAPLIRIADITPFMNHAEVRVTGTVTRAPYVSRRKGGVDYVSFVVEDGAGTLRVTAQGALARSLVERNLLPAAGAEVEVTGSLSPAANGPARLRLCAAEQLVVRTRAGAARPASR